MRVIGYGSRSLTKAEKNYFLHSGKLEFLALKVTANLFGLEFFKILKSYHKIAHYTYFVLKKKLFENVFFLRSYCKFCVLRD